MKENGMDEKKPHFNNEITDGNSKSGTNHSGHSKSGFRVAAESFCVAFSLFSRIPMPRVDWDERNTKAAVLFLPLVGVAIGAVEWGLLLLARRFSFPQTATALLLIAIPILITGGIHLDGLIDTADARHSFGTAEEKQRILKDPHVGAFGVIRLVLYLLFILTMMFFLISNIEMANTNLFAIATLPFALSRALTAFSVVWFRTARRDGIQHTLSNNGGRFADETISDDTAKMANVEKMTTGNKNRKKTIAVVEVCAAIVPVFFILSPLSAAVIILSQLLFLLWFRHFAYKEFGGTSGDLSGWFLCLSELLYLFIWTITGVFL